MKKRSLTSGEITLAKKMFGTAIDYSKVTLTDKKYAFFQPKGTAMAPNGNLYMYGCYHDDYSKKSNVTKSFFIHEMTHVWQFQNKILNPVVAAIELNLKHRFNYNASYNYLLDKKKDLVDYGMEEQAAIVQEYFLFLNKEASYSRHCNNECSDSEKEELYKAVLAKFLKNPSYAKNKSFPSLIARKKPKI